MFEQMFDDIAESMMKENINKSRKNRNKIEEEFKEEHDLNKLNDIDLSIKELNENIKINSIKDIKEDKNKDDLIIEEIKKENTNKEKKAQTQAINHE